MTISPERHKGGKFVYYHCTESKGKHGASWVREEDITAQLVHYFTRIQLSDGILQRLVDELAQVYGDKANFHRRQFNEHVREQKSITTLMEKQLMGKNIVQDVRKPFDMIMECNDRQVWCAQ